MARATQKRSWFSSIFSVDRLFGYRERAAKGKRKRSARLGVERLEDRTVPTVSLQNGVLSITNDNTVLLRLLPSFDEDDTSGLEDLGVFENQGRANSSAIPNAAYDVSDIQQIVVTTVGDNAVLFLDFTNGNFIPTNGINFNGGTGGNTGLDMFGPPDPFTNETETPFGPTSGQVVFDANPPIAYTNVTFINDTVPITGTATYQGTEFTEAVNVVDGPQLIIGADTFQTTQLNSTNPQMALPQNTFATVNFARKPNVIIDGLGGNDIYTVNNPATTTANNGLINLTTGQPADVGNQQTFHVLTPFNHSITYTIVGGIGNNTLVGPDLTNVWNVAGHNSGSVGSAFNPTGVVHSFSNIQNLTGGLEDDAFHIEAAGTLDGTIDGGSSGAIGNTLIGDNFGDVFTINGVNAGKETTGFATDCVFANIQNLQGGSGNDTFQFQGNGALTGAIDGGAGGNKIIGNDNDDNFLINGTDSGTISGLLGTKGFTHIANLQGGLADDTFTFFGDGKLTGSIDGGTAGPNGDTIVGNDTGDTFTITGTNAGHVSDPIHGNLIGVNFSNIQNLTGGLGSDTFIWAADRTLSGKIDGGAPGANGNTIIGDDMDRTFTINGVNAGTVSKLLPGGFVNIQNLTGGAGDDTFKFTGAGALTGKIVGLLGGGGTLNTIIGDNSDFVINGPNSGYIANILPAGFEGIGSLVGGIGDDTFTFFGDGTLTQTINGGGAGPNGDTIVGPNKATTFNITAANAGNIVTILTAGFTNIQNLTGGLADDTFVFGNAGSLTGTIDGGFSGANGNTITGTDNADGFIINGPNAGAAPGLLNAFRNIQNLNGGAGADNFAFLTGGALTGQINAGPGNDTITGSPDGAAFVINGANAGFIDTLLPAGFSGVENLIGGIGDDSFTFTNNGSLTGTINGGDHGAHGNTIVGNNLGDTFNITGADAGNITTLLTNGFTNIQNLTGGLASDTFVFSGGSLSGQIDGGGEGLTCNEIMGDNTARTYVIDGPNAGFISGILPGGFINVGMLVGGSGGNNTFIFRPNGSLECGLNGGGGGGGNKLIGSDEGVSYVINGTDSGFITGLLITNGPGGSGTVTGAPLGFFMTFTNIGSIQGGLAEDLFTFFGAGKLTGTIDGGNGGPNGNTIVGNDFGDSFTVTGNNSGTLSDAVHGVLVGGGFTNIQNLTGGLQDDTFTIGAAGSLSGTINGGGSGAAGNTLIGDNFGDVFTVNGVNAGTETTGAVTDCFFANIQNLTGGAGNDSFRFFGVGALTGKIDGGLGTNSITGNDTGDSFVIDGGVDPDNPVANAGTIIGLLGTKGFVNIQNLTGGLLDDTFTFVIGGSLEGAIDGGAGKNTIVGDDAGDSFTIDGTNAGNLAETGAAGNLLGAAGFTHIQNLTGGSNDDVFTFQAPGKLTGKIDGGDESAAGNTIVGDNNGDAWTIKGTNKGSIALILASGFSNITNLQGGLGDDTFTFSGFGLLTGFIDGGGSLEGEPAINTIVGNNAGDHFFLNGGFDESGTPNAGFIAGILEGSPSNANANGFSNIQNLIGGTGADIFSVLPGGSIDGNIKGGNGRDTLDYAQFNLLVSTNLELKTSTGIGGTFASLENFIGTPADVTNLVGDEPGNFDTLIGLNQSSVWAITGVNSGSINLSPVTGGVTGNVFFTFTGYENLTGGTAQDVFRFSGAGRADGTIDGGGGTDWLDYTLITGGVTVNLNADRFIVPPGANVLHGINLFGGQATRTGLVTNIQNVLGSARGGDTLIGNDLANVLVARVGNNTIMGNGGQDIMVGGPGHNLLVGSGAEDLIIAGSTSFDKNIIVLDEIQTKWTTNPFPLAVAAVRSGAHGLVVGKTVFLSPAPGPRFGRGGGFYASTVYGGGGHNLIFVRWTSLIVDFIKGMDTTVGNP